MLSPAFWSTKGWPDIATVLLLLLSVSMGRPGLPGAVQFAAKAFLVIAFLVLASAAAFERAAGWLCASVGCSPPVFCSTLEEICAFAFITTEVGRDPAL